jgi:glutaminyl-tRNA synthetase
VRLRYACLVKCTGVVKNDKGEVTELRCTWDPESRGGVPKDGRKVKGTLHWVSAAHAAKAEGRLYDRLFSKENPADDDDFLASLNPNSCETLSEARVEPSLRGAKEGELFQLERLGYFCVDRDSSSEKLVVNRTIGLRDSWAAKQGKAD